MHFKYGSLRCPHRGELDAADVRRHLQFGAMLERRNQSVRFRHKRRPSLSPASSVKRAVYTHIHRSCFLTLRATLTTVSRHEGLQVRRARAAAPARSSTQRSLRDPRFGELDKHVPREIVLREVFDALVLVLVEVGVVGGTLDLGHVWRGQLLRLKLLPV